MRSPILPGKLVYIKKLIKNKAFKLLDIGTGNHSATEIKHYFPNCTYYGVDITRDYSNSDEDFQLMEKFWEKDLTKLKFEDIPDNFFDVILMAHIVEHLHNGDIVIEKLLQKLKPGGIIYVEYPSGRSVNFPSKRGTLNFYDDATHVRIYTVEEVSKVMQKGNCVVLKSGVRRRIINIILMPFKMIHNLIKYRYISGSTYWDFYGFAEFVLAKKKV